MILVDFGYLREREAVWIKYIPACVSSRGRRKKEARRAGSAECEWPYDPSMCLPPKSRRPLIIIIIIKKRKPA